ncbi:hypothetical protein RRG08_015539 [Elysia crispata]|uniref:Uncharacterized protein n=1 Tax=Elysia crispata TaxID=231223 RepID=A0AAE0YJX4_9GAST|nr:hypothetical protein RRG08_015539 [Elysia crispata]
MGVWLPHLFRIEDLPTVNIDRVTGENIILPAVPGSADGCTIRHVQQQQQQQQRESVEDTSCIPHDYSEIRSPHSPTTVV